MVRDMLETGINFENAYEDYDVTHPLEGLSWLEIEEHFLEVSKAHPGYEDYVYEKNSRSHGYGAQTGWYELWGMKD